MKTMYKRLLLLLAALLAVALLTSCIAPVPIEKADVGDYVVFGHYEQDNNTDNGPEPIEWLVLHKANGRLLVVSKYILDGQPFHNKQQEVTWYGCSLRTWLNEDFLNAAFTDEEQAMIPITTIFADRNPDYKTSISRNTSDKIFLLDYWSVEDYFSHDGLTKASPTKYAIAQGVHANKYNHSTWWLRTPGYTLEYTSVVVWEGGAYTLGSKVNNLDGVRPGMWITIPQP